MSDAKGQHEPSMEEILASIRRIIAEDGDASPAAASAPAAGPAPAPSAAAAPMPPPRAPVDEVLELTEVVEEDGSVVKFGAKQQPQPGPPPPETEPIFELDPEAPAPEEDEETRLLSPKAADASAASLSQLLSRERDELPLGAHGRTLEDIVRELLRPLLKTWLDDNLPPLVERLVQDEIRRLVRDAHGR
jgi:uncharacterized protein